ncbi:MAG: hypothetical protein K2O18_04065 [Oscillospiraceae bacterium]|nr:hypothetical protein [Oscillospiraceae bacterium]
MGVFLKISLRAVRWGLRSPRYNNNNNFCAVNEEGSNNNNNADRSLGLRPGFCDTRSNGVTEPVNRFKVKDDRRKRRNTSLVKT